MRNGSSVVIKVKSPLAISGEGMIDLDILHQMFEVGLNALSESNDYSGYLAALFKKSELIGIKVNTLGGLGMSTTVEAVEVLTNLLDEAGAPKKRQLIWDRNDRELSSVGFSITNRGNGPLCFGTDHRGVGYSDRLVSRGKIGGLLSRILVDYCDSIINMPVLKDHNIAGITCSLKNHYGSIHNPNKYHDNGCDPYVADLNSLEQIRSRQRLIVVDALKVQYHGGPAYNRNWAIPYGTILFGTDPVAVDRIGYGIVEDLRKAAGMKPLKGTRREPIYIKRSAEYGLGNADPGKIELKELVV